MKRALAPAAVRSFLDLQRQTAGGEFPFGLPRGSSQGHNLITWSLGIGRALCSSSPALRPNPSVKGTHNGGLAMCSPARPVPPSCAPYLKRYSADK